MILILADIILIIHFFYILFVVLGQCLIVMGGLRGWEWIRNRSFRSIHLAAIGLVVVLSWIGKPCPLTVLEVSLRKSAGQPVHMDSFIEYWLNRFIYYDFPEWVFLTVYTIFGLIVLASWIWITPDYSKQKKSADK